VRFHRISPCPRCGGKVKAKWERDGVQGLPGIHVLYRDVPLALSAGSASREVVHGSRPVISCNTISPLGTAYATVINASR